jgi:hypothetical protein
MEEAMDLSQDRLLLELDFVLSVWYIVVCIKNIITF